MTAKNGVQRRRAAVGRAKSSELDRRLAILEREVSALGLTDRVRALAARISRIEAELLPNN